MVVNDFDGDDCDDGDHDGSDDFLLYASVILRMTITLYERPMQDEHVR